MKTNSGVKGSSSMVGRAVIAVVLMVGFYVLALVMAGVLLWLVYAEMHYAHRLHPKLAILCIVGAGAILWSVVPRPDRFEPPGPVMDRERQPRLFAEIDAIARAVNQAPPAEVYLVPDINAWVAQRGGVMGFGSRRVMGLGLPLLRVLTASEFRAVLAHEFGHYHGGDTQLGPWIYKTRAAIGRTLENLGETGSLLQYPFLWYGKMFLRVTHAVSRRQEFVADALAARTVGAAPLIGGLRKVHGVGPAFQAYWENECLPVLRAGCRPPLADGFATFVATGWVAEAIGKQVEEELQQAKADPYDTHPPLRERIEAVEPWLASDVPVDDSPAIAWLEEVPRLEGEMLETLAAQGGEQGATTLRPVPWEAVGQEVYVPRWQELVDANTAALAGVTAESLPTTAEGLAALAPNFLGRGGARLEGEAAAGLAEATVGSAITVLLLRRGARLEAVPGKPVSLDFQGTSLLPFSILSRLVDGTLTSGEWLATVDQMALRGVDLASASTSAAPA